MAGLCEFFRVRTPRPSRSELVTPTKLLIGQILVVVAIVIAGVWAATQWCAAMLARSEEHTSELQSLMRISYAVFCLKKKTNNEYKQLQNLYHENKHAQQSCDVMINTIQQC